LQGQDVASQTDSERLGQVSGLYDLGFVNPLSCGVAAIGNASTQTLDRRNAALRAQKDAEIARATASAYDMETDSVDKAFNIATQERKRIDDQATQQYEIQRQKVLDEVSMVNTLVDNWRQGRQLDIAEQQNAQQSVNNLVSMYGSSVFEGMDEDSITEMENAAGYSEGTLQKGLKTLKELEIEANQMNKNKPELREIGGSLYSISYDAEGNPKTQLVIGKPKGSSGSGSGGKFTDAFKAWYYSTFSEVADPTDANAQAEFSRWNDTGKAAGVKQRQT